MFRKAGEVCQQVVQCRLPMAFVIVIGNDIETAVHAIELVAFRTLQTCRIDVFLIDGSGEPGSKAAVFFAAPCARWFAAVIIDIA